MDKQCKRCREVKPAEDFYRHDGCRDGRRPECKACNLANQAALHRSNPEPARERTRRWQADNPDRVLAQKAQYATDGRKAISDRRSHLKRKYGITIEQYDDMLAAQGGVCAICECEPNPNISLHVDHDHETGLIRGLTCFRCNQAMGAFGEDPSLLRAAAAYLDRHDPAGAETRAAVRKRIEEIPPPAWKHTAGAPLASGRYDLLRSGR